MLVEVKLHPAAERELRAAFLRYAERNIIAADSFRAEAEHAIEAIGENPTRWPKLTKSERRYVLPIFPFTLVYRVKPGFVEVIAVAHQKRKPDYWAER